MKNNISPKNNKQDIKIGKLEVAFTDLKERFDSFISNDFKHLNWKVDKIIWTVVLGFVISITLMLAQLFLR